jgi:hypothetical protein
MTRYPAHTKACLAVLAAVPAMTFAESSTLIYGNVSGWTVHTDPNQAYRCYAEALYDGGSSIRLGFNEQGELYLSIADSSWAGTVAGREYELELQFDELEPQRLTVRGGAENGTLSYVIPNDERPAFLKEIQVRWSISAVHGNNEPVLLSLGGSFNASMMLEDCQASMASVNARS